VSKFTRVMLVLSLVITGFTTTPPVKTVALASSECPEAVQPGGSGTAADPYRIAAPAHLIWLSATSSEWIAKKEFLQVADIDFNGCLQNDDGGKGWSPIGNVATPFRGVYDGQGHTITDLFINRTSVEDGRAIGVGFFGRTVGAEIRHLHLIDVHITGSHEVGALIGTNASGEITTVYDVSASGSVTSTRTGTNAADTGGLFGYVFAIDITYARASVDVSATGRNVGGLIGDGTSGTFVSRSWATGDVTSTGTQEQIGGLVGLFRGDSGISDSYALGAVSSATGFDPVPTTLSDRGVGGLIGRLTTVSGNRPEIARSFSGGVVTPPSPHECGPDFCHFLIGSEVNDDRSGTNLPESSSVEDVRKAAELKVSEAWDLDSVWVLPDTGFPTLSTPPGRPVISELTRNGADVTVTVSSVQEFGLPVTAYEVTVGSTIETKSSEADLTLPSSFVVKLDDDASGPDVLRIRAVSGGVEGPSVEFRRPSAPQGLAAAHVTSDAIGLSWSAPADSGTGSVTAPTIDYVLELGTGGSFSPLPDTTGTTATLTGLDGAVEYVLRVRARNVIGLGPAAELTVATLGEIIVEESFDATPGSETGWRFSGTGTGSDGNPWVPQVSSEDGASNSRGALRLTEAMNSQAAFVVYDVPQQTRAGLDITFKIAQWRTSTAVNPADGMTFFLKRGDDNSLASGPAGSRLGYVGFDNNGTPVRGISGALLGVGFDAEGAFRRPDRNPACDDESISTNDNIRNNLTIRGPGQDTDGYCLLAVKDNMAWTDARDAPNGNLSRADAERRIRVSYDYVDASTGSLRVWVDDIGDSDTPALTVDAPQELLDSETFKFGFTASTGGRNNTHEVWDVVVRSVTPLAPVEWTVTALDEAVAGQAYAQSLDRKVRGGVQPFSFSLAGGQLPPGLTLNSPLTGTPTQPGTYTFDVTATSRRGGAATETVTLVVKDQQTLELDAPTQWLGSGSAIVAPVSRAKTSELVTGLAATVSSSTSDVCTVSGLTVTLVAVGTCTLTASQPGGTSGALSYTAAAPVTTSFEILPGSPPTRSESTPEAGTTVPASPVPPVPPGPVLTSGVPPQPSSVPTARIGEREVAVVPTPAGTTRQEGTTTVSTATILEVGTVALSLDLTGAGEVRTPAGGTPQLSVTRDRVARTSGGGMLPGTQVQVWLPLAGGTTIRPVTTIAVADDGTFTGDLPFDGSTDRLTDGRPLPIGTHVLQLVGVDAAGELIVIEQTIRIEQPAPSPEVDRRSGSLPAPRPGMSTATTAGLREAVTVTLSPDQRRARLEGSGWAMAIGVPSASGRVEPGEGDGALVALSDGDVFDVGGDGYLPGTRADVWVFSTPMLLGAVTIAPDGTFSGQVLLEGIATGEHTLQLQGVGDDGYVRAANLGVAIVSRGTDELAAAPEDEAAPEPGTREPDSTVEVVTAAGDEPSGSSSLVSIALIAALASSGGWWFLIGRRRRDDEEAEAAHQG